MAKKKKVTPEERPVKKKTTKGASDKSPSENVLKSIGKDLEKLWEVNADSQERIQDLEIQVNLLTHLLTNISLHMIKIKPRLFQKMIRDAESLVVKDAQVYHLE